MKHLQLIFNQPPHGQWISNPNLVGFLQNSCYSCYLLSISGRLNNIKKKLHYWWWEASLTLVTFLDNPSSSRHPRKPLHENGCMKKWERVVVRRRRPATGKGGGPFTQSHPRVSFWYIFLCFWVFRKPCSERKSVERSNTNYKKYFMLFQNFKHIFRMHSSVDCCVCFWRWNYLSFIPFVLPLLLAFACPGLPDFSSLSVLQLSPGFNFSSPMLPMYSVLRRLLDNTTPSTMRLLFFPSVRHLVSFVSDNDNTNPPQSAVGYNRCGDRWCCKEGCRTRGRPAQVFCLLSI